MEIYIYIIFEAILLFLTFNQITRTRKKYFIICCILLFIINGLHFGGWYIANDYGSYRDFFLGKSSQYGGMNIKGDYDLELPYLYYCKFLRFFGRSDFTYIAGTCLMFGIPFMWLTWKKSINPPMTLFLLLTFFVGQTYLFYLCAHRQMVATAFIIWSFIIYESQLKFKNILALACLAIGLIGHSTSYFIIPVLLLVYFLKIEFSKKFYIVVCLISMVLGAVAYKLFAGYITAIFISIADIEETARTTYYLANDVYGYGEMPYKRILLMTFTICGMLYYETKEEANSFYMKLLVISAVVYNLLNTVPLVNRMLTAFVLFGIAGGIPSAFKRRASNCRWGMLAVLLINWIFTIRYYFKDGFQYPFHFIWE